MIQMYEPSLRGEELKAVENVFKSNLIGKGKIVDSFIKDMSNKIISSVNLFVFIIYIKRQSYYNHN